MSAVKTVSRLEMSPPGKTAVASPGICSPLPSTGGKFRLRVMVVTPEALWVIPDRFLFLQRVTGVSVPNFSFSLTYQMSHSSQYARQTFVNY